MGGIIRSKSKLCVLYLNLFLIILLVISGCTRLVSYYDAISYKNLTDLKGEMNVFFERSAQEGAHGKSDLDILRAFRIDISKAYEYEKGKKSNDDTIAQLEILDKTVREVLDRYAKRTWTSEGKCSEIEEGAAIRPEDGCLTAGYSKAKWRIFEEAFDIAIETERSKLKEKE